MKHILITLLALGAIVVISGCHTLHGAGQDVKAVGRGVENAADSR